MTYSGMKWKRKINCDICNHPIGFQKKVYLNTLVACETCYWCWRSNLRAVKPKEFKIWIKERRDNLKNGIS